MNSRTTLWIFLLSLVLVPAFALADDKETGGFQARTYTSPQGGTLPYRLFALSNTGSMLALLSYPFIIEPLVSTRHQATIWSAAYALAAVLCAAAAMRVRTEASSGDLIEIQAGPGSRSEPATELRINSFSARTPGDSSPARHDDGEIRRDRASRLASSRKMQLLWVAFAACASALLLAITNHLSQNVAAVPFLWVLPLSLYLLSFIMCFEGRGWYRRDLFMKLCGVALGSMAYALSPEFANSSLYLLVPLFSAGLFVCCMVCHGELERLKPHPQHLTSFYLMIALGGATGGLFVGLAAPHIFSGYFELPVAMSACGALALVALRRDASGTFYEAHWKPVWLTLTV